MTAYLLLPGAGSAGVAWSELAAELDAAVLPIGDEPDVPGMAAALLPAVTAHVRPLVIVGGALGAMVALELARRTEVDGLVLIAAGLGITVAESVLRWVESDPPDLLAKLARIGLADPLEARLTQIRERDFAARGQATLLAHLRALAAYRPTPLPEPPPTLVLWGERDRGVPLADHVELARALGGALVPIAGVGHAPYLEKPVQTAGWVRRAALIV
jgi:pimeloyl-ACP methyl ester carboxylesterase